MATYLKRNGAIWFWRVGRIGGSFYVAKKPRPLVPVTPVPVPVVSDWLPFPFNPLYRIERPWRLRKPESFKL
jgi:hypothetical protein